MHLVMTLMFSDPPQVAIRMGKSLVASDIREGVDVYFNCVIRANPPPKTKIVTWLHNVSISKIVFSVCSMQYINNLKKLIWIDREIQIFLIVSSAQGPKKNYDRRSSRTYKLLGP